MPSPSPPHGIGSLEEGTTLLKTSRKEDPWREEGEGETDDGARMWKPLGFVDDTTPIYDDTAG
jgi:hypothetical protein